MTNYLSQLNLVVDCIHDLCNTWTKLDILKEVLVKAFSFLCSFLSSIYSLSGNHPPWEWEWSSNKYREGGGLQTLGPVPICSTKTLIVRLRRSSPRQCRVTTLFGVFATWCWCWITIGGGWIHNHWHVIKEKNKNFSHFVCWGETVYGLASDTSGAVA